MNSGAIWLDPETDQWIKDLAARYKISKAEAIRTIIEWAKEEGEP